jgi:hypothetical protein
VADGGITASVGREVGGMGVGNGSGVEGMVGEASIWRELVKLHADSRLTKSKQIITDLVLIIISLGSDSKGNDLFLPDRIAPFKTLSSYK